MLSFIRSLHLMTFLVYESVGAGWAVVVLGHYRQGS